MATPLPSIHFTYYQHNQYDLFKALMQMCFADMGGECAPKREMQLLSSLYPQGQIMAWDGQTLAGAVISRIVPYEDFNKAHTQAAILDLDRYESDAAVGNALYGLDIFVHPDYRSAKLGHIMYGKLMEAFRAANFTDFLGASRVSNYAQYASEMTLEQYVAKVINKEIKDGALSFHLYNGMTIFDVMYDFNKGDTVSAGCGVAMGYANPHYNPALPVCPQRMPHLTTTQPC